MRNEELRKSFANYLLENVKKPNDWDEETIGAFSTTPTMTILTKYFIFLVSKYREGEIYEAIHNFYVFNGSIKTIEAQIQWIKKSSKTKSMENLFKRKNIPVDETLEFVAQIFQLRICRLTDFEKHLESQTPAKETENTQPQATENQNIAQEKKKQYSKLLLGITLLCLLLVSAGFYQTNQQLSQANSQLALIDSMVFKPKYVGSQIQEKDTTPPKMASTSQVNVSAKNEKLLTFFTNNIYNAAFIHHKETWNFPTDPKGEDMNSVYGEPYRKEIKPLKQIDFKGVTLANNEIWIRFNLQNEAKEKLFIDNLFLKVTHQYAISEQVVISNAWLPKFTEKHYEVLLNPFALSYPMATFIEIAGGESKHFSLKVKNDKDKQIENQIVRFKIIASANDGKGNRYTIQSDKDYLLGFVKK